MRIKAVVIIILGLISVSLSSILIKLCDAPALVIAAYRLTIASLVYLSITRIKTGPILKNFNWSQRKVALISGIFLTIHFATWITSLQYTSVASSVVLVQSAPLFVAIASSVFLKEKPTLGMIIGIIITLFGGTFISIHDFAADKDSLIGNLLAIAGAIGAAGYMVAGRNLRSKIDTFNYVTVVYSIAAFFLIVVVLAGKFELFNYHFKTYILFFAIAIVPQVIGHTSFNWALKYFSATTVSVIILGEPIGASILAIFILGENLTITKLTSMFIILTGVIIVLIAETMTARKNNVKNYTNQRNLPK